MVDTLLRDLRLAARVHLKTPVTTMVAIAVLAFGIAATSVSFSLVNAFFVRPLPIAQSSRFVHVYQQSGPDPFPISYPEYEDVRALTAVFDGAVAEAPAPLIMGGAGAPERVWGEIVSDDYFAQLGVTASRGRLFSTAEDAVVLSDGFWRRRFGADPAILGRPIQIEGQPYRVVGIATGAFRGTIPGFESDLWIPAAAPSTRGAASWLATATTDRAERNYFVMARLASGIGIDQARAALETLATRLEREYPDSTRGIRFVALSESGGRFLNMRDSVFGVSMLTIAIALLVTIIACANVAGLLLVRAAARRNEIGVRLALGASRGRIAGQLLTEAAALSCGAGALGILLAWQATSLLSGMQVAIARGASASIDVGIDGRVLALSACVTMVTSLLCGLTPAIESSRPNLIAVLRAGVRDHAGGRSWSRQILLVAQVAVSMVLLAGGGLFVQSLQHARETDLGFDPANVVTAAVDTRGHRTPGDANRYWSTLLDQVRALPQTESASLTYRPPLEFGITRRPLGRDGFRPAEGQAWPETEFSAVMPGYFETLAITLADGRDFTDRDTVETPRVVILNDVIAQRFWPGGRAVGRFVVGPDGERFEVVGVARRSKYFSIGEPPTAYVYFPLLQGGARSMIVVARGAGDPRAYQQAIRDTVRRLDPTAPVDLGMLSERVRLALAPAAGGASAIGLVSLMALALTALGLFGTVAQTVGRRTYEIGVRRALGAPDGDVARLVLRETFVLIACGLGFGIVGALAASRPLGALLYDVDLADPLVFGMTPAVLLLVCALATCLPTWRALRINAATALRHE